MKYEKLFTPIKIGNVNIKNRFAMAPMGPLGLADADGGFNQRGIDYYVERARGGTGLIITGVTFVDNKVEEHGMPNCPSPTYNPVHFGYHFHPSPWFLPDHWHPYRKSAYQVVPILSESHWHRSPPEYQW